MYELVIAGGRLFDPGAGIDEAADLAIEEGKIAARIVGKSGARTATPGSPSAHSCPGNAIP